MTFSAGKTAHSIRSGCSILWHLFLPFSFLGVLFSNHLYVYAATLTVGPGQTFSTIAAGIAAAASGDTVQVYPNPPGHYPEDIALKSGVVVEGVETGRTKIVGTGTANSVTVVSNSTIMNMTIVNTNTAAGSAAILISQVTGAAVTNNLIVGSINGIECISSSNLTITNNTIDRNATGIGCSGSISSLIFENNIVSNNTMKGIDFSGATVSGTVNYNDVFNNSANSYSAGLNDLIGDPKFAAPPINDYHLQSGSACLNAGDPAPAFNDKEVSTSPVDYSRNDCGAYGGAQRDTTPFQIQNIVATPGTGSIVLTWYADAAYDTGAYNIFYDNQVHTVLNGIPTPPYQNTFTLPATPSACPPSPSPSVCAATVSLTLGAPVNLQAGFGNQALFLSWAPPSGLNLVTGYNINFKEDTASTWKRLSVGNLNSYTLTGLTNLILYDVYLTAVASSTYSINLAAQDLYATPHESALVSPAATATVNGGVPMEGPPSAIASNYPETLAPYPDLPNRGGCFIATAAYGSPFQPEVALLRTFRDRYLAPYDWGARFISWYYHFSPPWARYLNEHLWLKPVVRAGLTPAVGIAYFLVAMTAVERSLLLLLALLFLAGGVMAMRKMKRSGD